MSVIFKSFGKALARKLRGRGEDAAIVFITPNPDYAIQGYDVGAVWILAMTLLTAAAVPFVYWLFGKLLRRALAGFTAKNVRYLCATPALFFLFYAYSIFAVPYFNQVFLLLTPVVGVFSAYVDLRMILNLRELDQYKSDMQVQELKNVSVFP